MTQGTKIPDALLRLLFRPRVIHRLPGRLRIHVPFLKPDQLDGSHVVDLILDLVKAPGEITNVQRHPHSTNFLVSYDPERSTEREIMSFIQALFGIYIKNRRALDGLPAERWPAVTPRLTEWILASLGPRLSLNPDLVIDNDVLA